VALNFFFVSPSRHFITSQHTWLQQVLFLLLRGKWTPVSFMLGPTLVKKRERAHGSLKTVNTKTQIATKLCSSSGPHDRNSHIGVYIMLCDYRRGLHHLTRKQISFVFRSQQHPPAPNLTGKDCALLCVCRGKRFLVYRVLSQHRCSCCRWQLCQSCNKLYYFSDSSSPFHYQLAMSQQYETKQPLLDGLLGSSRPGAGNFKSLTNPFQLSPGDYVATRLDENLSLG